MTPLTADDEANVTLKEGDVIKITLGAQIDGYASIVSETTIVGKAVVTGKVADAITAAWYASEAAIRTIKPGNKNWAITSIVDKVAAQYGVKPLEGMLSHNQNQNVLDGKKEIIINPTESQRSSVEDFVFEEGEVYGLDILVSTGEGKVKQGETRTTIYKLTDTTYQLKLKASRAVFSEIQKKAGKFPFTTRILDDPKKGRMGLQECQAHGLINAYDIVYEKEGEVIAQFYTTVAITKNGIVKFTSPSINFDQIKSDKKIEDKEILELLSKPLKTNKKKNKKTAAPAPTPKAD